MEKPKKTRDHYANLRIFQYVVTAALLLLIFGRALVRLMFQH